MNPMTTMKMRMTTRYEYMHAHIYIGLDFHLSTIILTVYITFLLDGPEVPSWPPQSECIAYKRESQAEGRRYRRRRRGAIIYMTVLIGHCIC